jgi:TPR repeat protein
LYQKAADLGNADGINYLGYCYLDGIGTDIDKDDEIYWYKNLLNKLNKKSKC